MSDPVKQIVTLLEERMAKNVTRGIMGLPPCVLGTMTATGVLLDDFKHEIKDPLYADWHFKLEMPQPSRVVVLAAPVNSDGSDIPPTQYSPLTRIDWTVVGDPNTTIHVHSELKSELQPGDRVLVVPINAGQECVIICKVVS